MNSFLKPSDKVIAYKRAGESWSILRDQSKDFYMLKANDGKTTDAELQKDYEGLLKSKEEATKNNPIIPIWAYDQAKAELDKKNKKNEKDYGQPLKPLAIGL